MFQNLCQELTICHAEIKLAHYRMCSVVAPQQHEYHKSAYRKQCEKLLHLTRRVGVDGSWVYPKLLGTSVEIVRAHAEYIYRESPEDEIARKRQSLDKYIDTLDSLKQWMIGQSAMSSLQALVQALRSPALPRIENRPWTEVISLLANDVYPATVDTYSQIRLWWEENCNTSDPQLRLERLLAAWPRLNSIEPIVQDLMDRHANTLYFPFVANDIGVLLPIRIEANLLQPAHDIAIIPADIDVDDTFVQSVRKARSTANHMLALFERSRSDDFLLQVELPQVTLGENLLPYTDASAELPIAIAVVRSALHPHMDLQPTATASGVIRSSSIEPKIDAINSDELLGGEGGRLIVSTEEHHVDGSRHVLAFKPKKYELLLRGYLGDKAWDSLQQALPNTISCNDISWDDPLKSARHMNTPVIDMERHTATIIQTLNENHLVQVCGMPGIGKSVIVAQCVRELTRPGSANENYSLVIHMSLPEGDMDERAFRDWQSATIKQMAEHLAERERPQLLQAINLYPDLHDPEKLREYFRTALRHLKVLFIVDNAQSLLSLLEEKSAASHRWLRLMQFLSEDGHHFMMVTNRDIPRGYWHLPRHPVDDGFTTDEAEAYLASSLTKWPHHLALRRRFASALGWHPEALAVLCGAVKEGGLTEFDLEEIVALEAKSYGDNDVIVDEERLRERVWPAIMGKLVENLSETVRWTLFLASTFRISFSLIALQNLKKAAPNTLWSRRNSCAPDVSELAGRSLILQSGPRSLRMHGLVRGYMQDKLKETHQQIFASSHRLAGMYYFPLGEAKKQVANHHAREYLEDIKFCSEAMYHYAAAQYEHGVLAVINNSYQHAIPHAIKQIADGARPGKPTYGYYGAQLTLQPLVDWWKSDEDPEGVAGCAFDVNQYMAEALYGQIRYRYNYQKAMLAAQHVRELVFAPLKDKKRFLPLFICVLGEIWLHQADGEEKDRARDELVAAFETVDADLKKNPAARYENIQDAYEMRARVYLAEGDRGNADLILRTLIGQGHASQSAFVALVELSDSDLDRAELLKQGLAEHPQSAFLFRIACRHATSVERLHELKEYALKHKPSVNALNGCVMDLLALGRAEDAKIILLCALELFPHNGFLWSIYEGRFETESGKEARLLKGIDRFPWLPYTYDALANMYVRDGRTQEAINILVQGIEVNKDADLYLSLSNIYLSELRIDEAIKLLQLGIAKTHNAILYHSLGAIYLSEHKIDEATKLLEIGIAKTRAPALHVSLARLYELQGNMHQALDILSEGIVSTEQDSSLYLAKAALFLGDSDRLRLANRPKDALDALNNAVKAVCEGFDATDDQLMTPSVISLLLRREHEEKTTGSLSEAERCLDQAIQFLSRKITPPDLQPLITFARCVVHFRRMEQNAAPDNLEETVSLDYDPLIHAKRAIMYLEEHNWDEAIVEFGLFLTSNTNNASKSEGGSTNSFILERALASITNDAKSSNCIANLGGTAKWAMTTHEMQVLLERHNLSTD